MLTLDRIRTVVSEIAPKYGIEKVYLFGSYACGDAIEESDVDLHITGANPRTLLGLAKLHIELEEIFEKSVDIYAPGKVNGRFYELIKNTEVLIYTSLRR
ncbi:hypothetical protein FACS1894187_05660 [Synergistales bacterium]|nr:hypothetical protein FACS1894187_05660 [Synergistales bacterium]